MSKTVPFQTIQFSISTQFQCQKTVLFQTIQFYISMQFSSIWTKDRTLSGATTLGQCEPGSDGNEGLLHIPQDSSSTGTSPSDCLESYLWPLVGGSLTLLQRCSQCILQPSHKLTGEQGLIYGSNRNILSFSILETI